MMTLPIRAELPLDLLIELETDTACAKAIGFNLDFSHILRWKCGLDLNGRQSLWRQISTDHSGIFRIPRVLVNGPRERERLVAELEALKEIVRYLKNDSQLPAAVAEVVSDRMGLAYAFIEKELKNLDVLKARREREAEESAEREAEERARLKARQEEAVLKADLHRGNTFKRGEFDDLLKEEVSDGPVQS